MSKKQWIWLCVAVVLFALAGTASVAVNTWSKRALADSFGSVLGGPAELSVSEFPAEPFVARLDIEGTITSSSGTGSILSAATGFDLDGILDYIDELTDCPSNEGILLYVDSGGGEIGASDEVYLKLMDYKAATGRPIYAYFADTACSGAYYIAMAADEIYANRNSVCVNIGVYIETYNLAGLFEKYGVEEIMIKSSDNKGIGAVGQPWTEEQRAIYQSIVDLYYDQFLEVVAAGRGMTKDTVRALDDGREMLALQALRTGFIDGIGRWEEYQEQVLGYFGDEAFLYEEPDGASEPLLDMLRQIYGELKALMPRSDGELLTEFARGQEGIVVMAYAR